MIIRRTAPSGWWAPPLGVWGAGFLTWVCTARPSPRRAAAPGAEPREKVHRLVRHLGTEPQWHPGAQTPLSFHLDSVTSYPPEGASTGKPACSRCSRSCWETVPPEGQGAGGFDSINPPVRYTRVCVDRETERAAARRPDISSSFLSSGLPFFFKRQGHLGEEGEATKASCRDTAFINLESAAERGASGSSPPPS